MKIIRLTIITIFFSAFLLNAQHAGAQAYLPTQKQKVFIKGVEVISNDTKKRTTITEELPTQFQGVRTRMAIENRQRIKVYDHAPSIGASQADITVIEFNDLSCLQCQGISKKVDELRKKYPQRIRQIYIHAPLDPYNTTNPAAFYGRIAYNNNMFWEFKKALYGKEKSSENIYIDALLDAGLTMNKIRQDIKDFSRKFYREIDADSQLVAQIGEKSIPVVFINGIRIGNTIDIEDTSALVDYEIEQIKMSQ